MSCLLVVATVPGRVTAHGGVGGTAPTGPDLVWIAGGVAAVGAIGGAAAAKTRLELQTRAPAIPRWIGALPLAGLGIAVLSAAFRDAATAGIGGGLGVAGGLVVARLDRRLRASATTGALGLHRVVEGIALAALGGGGATLSLVAVVVLAGHTVAECVAIGGHPGLDWRQAVASVVVVAISFIAGVAAGEYGAASVVPGSWLLATLGGFLVTQGAIESGADGGAR